MEATLQQQAEQYLGTAIDPLEWDDATPMRFEPSDFSTDKYRCVNVINLRDRCPVIIMASESCDPPYYRVVDGSLEMFYLSYSEAVDYCRQSGYMHKNNFSGGLL